MTRRRVASQAVELLPFEEYCASLPLKRMSAGLFVWDGHDRVLLLETVYKPDREIPGGVVEAGEAPWVTAAREAREELGQARPLGSLLVLDHMAADGPMPEGMAFIFDGGTITDDEVQALALPDPEIASAGLFSLDEVHKLVGAGLYRRLVVALDAVRSGRLALCDGGRPVAL